MTPEGNFLVDFRCRGDFVKFKIQYRDNLYINLLVELRLVCALLKVSSTFLSTYRNFRKICKYENEKYTYICCLNFEVQKINFPVELTHFGGHQKMRQDSENNFMSSIKTIRRQNKPERTTTAF